MNFTSPIMEEIILMKGMDMNMNELKKIFGNKIGNALLRMQINSIEELKTYHALHPFEGNTKYYIWRNIGPVSYNIIKEYLEES